MTKDQAQQTQCCGGEGCGYVNPTDGLRYCIADGCMAWRWTGRSLQPGEGLAPGEYRESGGHCGLAGRP